MLLWKSCNITVKGLAEYISSRFWTKRRRSSRTNYRKSPSVQLLKQRSTSFVSSVSTCKIQLSTEQYLFANTLCDQGVQFVK